MIHLHNENELSNLILDNEYAIVFVCYAIDEIDFMDSLEQLSEAYKDNIAFGIWDCEYNQGKPTIDGCSKAVNAFYNGEPMANKVKFDVLSIDNFAKDVTFAKL